MPFFWITSALASGILIAKSQSLPPSVWGWGCIGLFLSGICLLFLSKRLSNSRISNLGYRLPQTALPMLLLPGFLALGGWLYDQHLPSPANSIYSMQGQSMHLTARVAEPPDIREDKILAEVQVNDFTAVNGSTIHTHEKLLLVLPAGTDIHYGDRLILDGKPQLPFENADFSYREYLAGREIFSILYYPRINSITPDSRWSLKRTLFQFRDRSLALLDRIYSMPESALIQGILLGVDNDIPADLYDSFRNSGTSHVIAISGFNVSIVSGLTVWFLGKLLGKRRGTLISIIIIVLYTILVGASPSVVRAAIMGSLGMIGSILGRKSGTINTIFLAAGLMLVDNPLLIGSISFQLSVAATLGMVLYAHLLHEKTLEWFTRRMPEETANLVGGWFSEYFLYTIAAQIPAIPFLLYHFQQLPWVTLITNPLILPAQPMVMITGGLALLAAWISPTLGQVAGFLSQPFLSYTIRVVEWCAGLSISKFVTTNVGGFFGFVWIFFLSLPAAIHGLRLWLNARLKSLLLFTCLMAITLFLILLGVHRPDGLLTVTVMGGKDPSGILIQSPAGNTILINGGASRTRLLTFLDKRIPFYKRSLDLAVVSNEKSAAALPEVLELIPAENIYTFTSLSPDYLSNSSFTPILVSSAGDISLDSGITIRFTSPAEGDARADIIYQNLQMRIQIRGDGVNDACEFNVAIQNDGSVQTTPSCANAIWISRSTSVPGVIPLDGTDWVSIKSDGSKVWMEKQ